ncbi:transporter substrate-binding domain-containing protein [uncultured Pseudodesulfovibrio sp.]|uniref:substrate-binding periplasmic protein n=1 Tax=uncultured Pseudodesulfovibrio sp. TaxID=2035858 RepID=UPI0029C8D974|nr:transporter substrate-binding domain-containing protein [uncultured Pseudodesulfovibrio sp.]
MQNNQLPIALNLFQNRLFVAIRAKVSNSEKVKRNAFILTVISVFMVLTMPSSSHAAGYPEWQAPRACIFGMPYIGNAVRKGNSGLITDILVRVYEPEGYELIHRELPYNRAVKELLAGTIHCTLDIEDTRKDVLQSRQAIILYDLAVAYFHKNTFKNIQSLTGKKVAYLHGYNLESLFPVKFIPRQTYDLSSSIQMLDRGHIDFVIDDETLLKEAMFEAKIPSTEFDITYLRSMKAHPIFTLTDEGRKLRDIYDRRIMEMTATGELQELMRRHGIPEESIQKLLNANTR